MYLFTGLAGHGFHTAGFTGRERPFHYGGGSREQTQTTQSYVWGMSKGCYADPHRVFPELGLSGDGTVSATRQRPGRVAVSVSDTCYVIQPVLVLCSVFGYPVELL